MHLPACEMSQSKAASTPLHPVLLRAVFTSSVLNPISTSLLIMMSFFKSDMLAFSAPCQTLLVSHPTSYVLEMRIFETTLKPLWSPKSIIYLVKVPESDAYTFPVKTILRKELNDHCLYSAFPTSPQSSLHCQRVNISLLWSHLEVQEISLASPTEARCQYLFLGLRQICWKFGHFYVTSCCS